MNKNIRCANRFSSSKNLTLLALCTGLIATALGQKEVLETPIEIEQSLFDNGINPYATYIGEVFTNHSGGIEDGTAWSGILDVGIELDLGKVVGWQGASFIANAFYFAGDDITGDRIGDFNAASNIFTDTSINFYNIFFQQNFGSGDSFFKLGQVALDDDFFVTESSLLFINSGFGPLPIQSGNTGSPIFGLAAPGAVLNYDFENSSFLQLGVYLGDAGDAEAGNQGFDWRTGSAAGYMFIAETGINYGQNDASVIKLGAFYHTGEFERFSDGESERGIYGIYAMADHQLLSNDSGSTLNAFIRGGISPQDEIVTVTSYLEAGFVTRNTFLPDDALGLGASWTNFSEDFRSLEGGTSSETVLEITYQVALSDHITLQPDIQYIINPQTSRANAFVTGLRAEVAF